MHFATALTLVASASTLVSARLDQVRRHGDPAAAAHLAARAPAPAPVPEPFRLFPAPGATDDSDRALGHEGRLALKARGGSGPVSEDALEAMLVSAHPLGHFADAPKLAKRSDAPKKGSKCHKKKRPSTAKAADTSAGQSLAVATEPKEASQRKTWADRQHDSAAKKGANGDHKGKDAAAEESTKKKAEDAFASKENTQFAATPKSSDKGDGEGKKTWEEEKKKEKKPESTPVFDGGANNKGLIGFTTDNCGPSGATEQDPNGSESFLSCGISKSNPSSPWQVPKGVTLDNIKTVSIEHALATNSVWEPCKRFIPLFEKYGAQTGLPPILLAALALQESTCNPDVLGDSGGAFGLMQITQDKCGGQDKYGCSEPDYNVRTGAEYFKKELDNAGGSFLEALARYNGWQPYTMTYSSATAAAYSDCCHCQNNLDYLYQMANGWLLGRTGYELGSFKNLAVCD